jgi:hypothetical protein
MNLAYLDAGTGSLIVQTVLGGAAGLAVLFKTSGRRLFKRGSSSTPEATTEQNAAPAEQSAES